MKKVAYFFGLIIATIVGMLIFKSNDDAVTTSMVLSVTIFSMFIYGTLLFGEFRLAFAFGGIALLLGLNLLTVQQFVLSAQLNVIIFLVGMFLVIGYLEENEFFEHIVGAIVGWVGPRPKSLLLVLMIMGTISAALVDEVTSILFMSGTMLHLTTKYKLNPIPFIIMLVFATNIGSSASSIGNPIGVMIALNAGFSFAEFLRWAAPVAIAVNLVTYFICRWWFAKDFKAFADAVQAEFDAKSKKLPGAVSDAEQHQSQAFPGEPHSLLIPWIVFISTILLLVTHGLTEKLLGWVFDASKIVDGVKHYSLPEGTMMIGAALLMGCVVLLLRGAKARELVERRVDWWTLSFFMMLFASVGTLEHTGFTKVIATNLIEATGGNQGMQIQLVGWITGILSAFLDNVLAVATFMPVVLDIRVAHAALHNGAGYPESIYWMMLFGGTYMGNMTIIGSTANIIAVGILEKRGHGTISFWHWMKIGMIVSFASMLVATALLLAQYKMDRLLPAPPANAKAVTSH